MHFDGTACQKHIMDFLDKLYFLRMQKRCELDLGVGPTVRNHAAKPCLSADCRCQGGKNHSLTFEIHGLSSTSPNLSSDEYNHYSNTFKHIKYVSSNIKRFTNICATNILKSLYLNSALTIKQPTASCHISHCS